VVDEPKFDQVTYVDPEDDAIWHRAPGLRVWSTDGRYLLEEDFLVEHPDAPRVEP
jgi:hypothetical protein